MELSERMKNAPTDYSWDVGSEVVKIEQVQNWADEVAQLEVENGRLLGQIGVAYWRGHTDGRIWGKSPIEKAEISRGMKTIDELKALGGE